MSPVMLSRADIIREGAFPLEGPSGDFGPLIDMIGDARFVLLGEATHGTHEFYLARAEISMRLIREKGFKAVAVEADWPDALRANRYVRGGGDLREPAEGLSEFRRFPLWMWRNTAVEDFLRRLRGYNDPLPTDQRVGFYGLDLYSLYGSMAAVIEYLDRVDPEAARRARYRYSCFEDFHEDPQAYGYSASFGLSPTCQQAVIQQLLELRKTAAQYLARDGAQAEDEQFFAEQNARLARNAEEYYRSMFSGRDVSWNLRDGHMAETLAALSEHLSRQGGQARVIVWEHNSHLGDARATEMSRQGELNVGQLARERYGADAVLVGFTTHQGTVSAASDWGGPVELKRIRPSLPHSYERLLHEAGWPAFMLLIRPGGAAVDALRGERLERAIGVIYRPESERVSHYFHAELADQFDAVVHFDETRAVEPLERTPRWRLTHEDAPETYPSGL